MSSVSLVNLCRGRRLAWTAIHDTWLAAGSEQFLAILLPQLLILWVLARWSARAVRAALPEARLLAPLLQDPHWLSLVSVGVIYVLALDFGTYVAHVALHRVSILWPFHAVHHEAPVLTPLTASRAHPVGLVTVAFVQSAIAGAILGVWISLGANTVTYPRLLGTNMLLFGFRAMFACLRHSPRPMPFGRLDAVLVSPSMHQLHHSRDRAFYGRNYGVVLSIWDRRFGISASVSRTRARLHRPLS